MDPFQGRAGAFLLVTRAPQGPLPLGTGLGQWLGPLLLPSLVTHSPFPAQACCLWLWFPTFLLLSLPGRVARAGRSGTAYSLVAPDEMPYVFDLHLFLGRPLILAGAQELPAGKANPSQTLG